MTSPRADQELAEMAHRQGGVFTRAQAGAAGVSRGAVARRVERGIWTVVHGRVLTASTTVLDEPGRLWSALLAAGSSSVVSRASAAQLWGLGVAAPRDVELTTTGGRTPTVPGALVRRRPLGPDDLGEVRGIAVTSQRRTVVDCLATLPAAEAGMLLDRSWRAGIITPRRLAAQARLRAGTTGVQQLRLLAEGPSATAAWFPVERLGAVLRRAGVRGWELHREVAPGLLAPLAFAAERLALLVAARLPELRRRDDEQCTALGLAGWRTLVLDFHVAVLDPARTVAAVDRARAAAGIAPAPGP